MTLFTDYKIEKDLKCFPEYLSRYYILF